MGAFANPFDPDKLPWSGCPCGKHRSLLEHQTAMAAAKGQPGSPFICEDVAEAAPETGPGLNLAGGAVMPHESEICVDPACIDPGCGDKTVASFTIPVETDEEPDGSNMEDTLALAWARSWKWPSSVIKLRRSSCPRWPRKIRSARTAPSSIRPRQSSWTATA